MNPKLIMLSAMALGVIGSAVGVQGNFDGKFHYCLPVENGCEQRSIPDWMQPPTSALNVRRTQGAAGWKLLGSCVAVAGFSISMTLARSLTEVESKKQKYSQVWEGVNLQKLRLQAQADLESFNQQVMIQAAEQSYAVLAPYQEGLLDADVVTEAIAPTTQEVSTPADQTETKPDPHPWLKGYLSSTALVWGNQGSGKSWFVRLLAKRKAQMGYRVIVFDPNSNATEWQGVELYNTYSAIEEQMRWYVQEVMQRYEDFGSSTISEEEWRSQLWKQGKAVTIIAEEATTYADFIEDKELLTKFVKVGGTLSRKQEMPVTFVAHNNTQSCLGDIKGLANLIARMQQIQLLATTDPLTSQPVASGKALIRLDGSTEWMEVTTPKIDKKITVFHRTGESDRTPEPIQPTEDSSPDDLWQRAIERLEATFQQDTAEDTTVPNVSSNDEDSDTTDTSVSSHDDDTVGNSDNEDTPDTYPEGHGFPPEKQLLTMLRDTKLPAGRFIKEVLKATKPERYRLARKAIAFVLRRYGDLELMQKFKDCL